MANKSISAAGWAAVRAAAGLLLAVSGFEKLTAPYQNFAFVIEQYRVISGPQAAVVAQVFPWVEWITGVFLLLGLWTRAAGTAALVMLAIFLGAVGQALMRRLPIDECGCFGDWVSVPLPVVFGMDMMLAALMVEGLRRKPGMRTLSVDAV